ncbi:MAG: Crp/Fnr family transcriptional regulator [Elusimicrobiales bacterium]|nr:Crp/Fnr family transcriptional regulator [Elusimicrobiales bacterium]
MSFKAHNNPNCFKCICKKDCVFNDLDLKTKKEWNNLKHSVSYKNGDFAFEEGKRPDRIFIVCNGRVKIFATDSNGQQLITWIHHPGKVFGHITLFMEANYDATAECMGKSVISTITRKAFKHLLDSHPKLSMLFLKQLSADIYAMQINLKDTAYKPAKEKIAGTLLKSISFKSKNTEYPTIHGLKRTEIAEITGLALETVVRALAAMEKNKIIKREVKCIKIINLAELKKMSETHK